MRVAAVKLDQPNRTDHVPPATKREFSRQLKVTRKAADDQASPEVAPPTQPQTLGQIVIALLGAGNAEPHPDAAKALPAGNLSTIAVPTTGPVSETTADPLAAPASAAVAVAPPVAKPELPLTPLEQAVHDLLSELGSDDHDRPPVGTMLAPLAPPVTALETPEAPVVPQPVAVAAQQQPAELTSQHHAHIVLDEPGLRVVMTVAVRGSEVNVNVRSSDDQTAAALARNAGSLDEAMRAHKLDLTSFTADREPTGERGKPHHERDPKPTQPFVLEETV